MLKQELWGRIKIRERKVIMSITLEQVDQVRERTGVSYQKAKEALEKANGDVVDAIVLLEEEKPAKEKFHHSASDFGNEVIKTLKELLNSGNVNRIVVEKDEQVVMNIPVTVGALGALFLTSATVVGLIAALATGCVIKIHKENGEVVNVNEVASGYVSKTKDKVEEVYETAKSRVKNPHVYEEEVSVHVEVEEEFEPEEEAEEESEE